jgi:hypothetical protein
MKFPVRANNGIKIVPSMWTYTCVSTHVTKNSISLKTSAVKTKPHKYKRGWSVRYNSAHMPNHYCVTWHIPCLRLALLVFSDTLQLPSYLSVSCTTHTTICHAFTLLLFWLLDPRGWLIWSNTVFSEQNEHGLEKFWYISTTWERLTWQIKKVHQEII